MYCGCVTFQSSPLSLRPTTTFVYHCHCTILETQKSSLVGQTFNVLIPHDEQSPIKQFCFCHSSPTSLGQIIELYKSSNPANVI